MKVTTTYQQPVPQQYTAHDVQSFFMGSMQCVVLKMAKDYEEQQQDHLDEEEKKKERGDDRLIQ